MNRHESRLKNIEVELTPKEWAIRLALEGRKFKSATDLLRSWAMGRFEELPSIRPFTMLDEQAKARHPSHKPESIEARHRLARRLRADYRKRQLLLVKAARVVLEQTQRLATLGALSFSQLHPLIRQDAFAVAAERAALWLKRLEPAAGDEAERQALIADLAASANDHRAQKGRETIWAVVGTPLPSALGEWRHRTIESLEHSFAHLAAIRLIEKQFFDGHSILGPDFNSVVGRVMEEIGTGVAAYNEYLRGREPLPAVGSDPAKPGAGLAIDLETVRANTSAEWAASIAARWAEEAEEISPEEQFERFREEWA